MSRQLADNANHLHAGALGLIATVDGVAGSCGSQSRRSPIWRRAFHANGERLAKGCDIRTTAYQQRGQVSTSARELRQGCCFPLEQSGAPLPAHGVHRVLAARAACCTMLPAEPSRQFTGVRGNLGSLAWRAPSGRGSSAGRAPYTVRFTGGAAPCVPVSALVLT